MKIHEYQAKEILRGFGVAVPKGKLVQSAEEAVAAARELMAGGKKIVVLKAQIHAGGRGKGGASSWRSRRKRLARSSRR